MRFFRIFLVLVISFSCIKPPEKEDVDEILILPTTEDSSINELLVLNEGLFQQNNSELSLIGIDEPAVQNNYFEKLTGKPLGDTGNDMAVNGEKIYIVVYSSSKIEILDKKTLNHLGTVPVFKNGKARGPRSIAFSGNEFWISTYDGYVLSYDTVAFNSNKEIKVGRNPEGLCFANNKLFVANSGGLDAPNYDQTVSIVDLKNDQVREIDVAINLSSIISFEDLVYVNSRGNYQDISSKVYQIDAVLEEVVQSYDFGGTHLKLKGDTLVIGHYSYITSSSHISYHDAHDGKYILNDALDIAHIKTLFGVSVLKNGQIICCDANNFSGSGTVTVFEREKVKSKYEVGLLPIEVLLIK